MTWFIFKEYSYLILYCPISIRSDKPHGLLSLSPPPPPVTAPRRRFSPGAITSPPAPVHPRRCSHVAAYSCRFPAAVRPSLRIALASTSSRSRPPSSAPLPLPPLLFFSSSSHRLLHHYRRSGRPNALLPKLRMSRCIPALKGTFPSINSKISPPERRHLPRFQPRAAATAVIFAPDEYCFNSSPLAPPRPLFSFPTTHSHYPTL